MAKLLVYNYQTSRKYPSWGQGGWAWPGNHSQDWQARNIPWSTCGQDWQAPLECRRTKAGDGPVKRFWASKIHFTAGVSRAAARCSLCCIGAVSLPLCAQLVYSFTRAVITKYHRLGSLNNRDVFPRSPWGYNSRKKRVVRVDLFWDLSPWLVDDHLLVSS